MFDQIDSQLDVNSDSQQKNQNHNEVIPDQEIRDLELIQNPNQ